MGRGMELVNFFTMNPNLKYIFFFWGGGARVSECFTLNQNLNFFGRGGMGVGAEGGGEGG